MKIGLAAKERSFKKAFTIIGLGVGFALWYLVNSVFIFVASLFIFMGIGMLIDILYYNKDEEKSS
jgi:hypothetical protein